MDQIIAQNEVTMSSLEIVRLINDSRGEDQAVLLHKNFLAKVPEVLGADHSAKFLAQYKDSTGFLGYQPRIQQGLLEHKVTVVSRTDGSEKVTEQVLVTGKGMAKLALMLEGVAA